MMWRESHSGLCSVGKDSALEVEATGTEEACACVQEQVQIWHELGQREHGKSLERHTQRMEWCVKSMEDQHDMAGTTRAKELAIFSFKAQLVLTMVAGEEASIIPNKCDFTHTDIVPDLITWKKDAGTAGVCIINN
eukprot:1160338-Pelagomonas_calceolata.AAC.4